MRCGNCARPKTRSSSAPASGPAPGSRCTAGPHAVYGAIARSGADHRPSSERSAVPPTARRANRARPMPSLRQARAGTRPRRVCRLCGEKAGCRPGPIVANLVLLMTRCVRPAWAADRWIVFLRRHAESKGPEAILAQMTGDLRQSGLEREAAVDVVDANSGIVNRCP